MKGLDKIREDERAESVWSEGADGYWVDLAPGWKCIYADAHCCHESTVRDLTRAFKDIEPCECEDCALRKARKARKAEAL